MDRNLLLAFALSFLVITLWMSMQPPPEPLPEDGEAGVESLAGDEAAGRGEAPAPDWVEDGGTARAGRPAGPPAASDESPTGVPMFDPDTEPAEVVRIESDLWRAELTSRGAALKSWELKEYYDASRESQPLVDLVTQPEGFAAALATPFREFGYGDFSRADFEVRRVSAYTVEFDRTIEGIAVRKRFVFDPDRYVFRMEIAVQNGTRRIVSPIFQTIWPATPTEGSDFVEYALAVDQDGSATKVPVAGVGKPGFFGGLFGGDPTRPQVFSGGVEWAGTNNRYFLAAIIPEAPERTSARIVPEIPGEVGVSEIFLERPVELPPGQVHTGVYQVFVGPKDRELLNAETLATAGLEASIDLGWSWMAPVTRFFAMLLKNLHSIVPNYGLAIIIITVLVRLVTAPLTARQMRSMKKMSEIQPRIKALQEKHKDDRQMQSQAMMQLWKEAGVNPLGGCLPLLMQFPVFIGLFYALQSSIELRQAPFFLWIDDLSMPESLFVIPGLEIPLRVLPVIMGASMVLQQKLSPAAMDPQQARMMMTVMPVMFTVLFYQFPSGLVLYWMVSNLLAIGHQLWMNRSKTTS